MEQHYMVYAVRDAVVALPGANGLATCSDVVKSCLLAQLVANKKMQMKAAVDWYDAYLQVVDDFWIRSLKAQQHFSLGPQSGSSPLEWAAGMMTNCKDRSGQAFAAFLPHIAHLNSSVAAIGELPGNASPPLQDVRLLAILALTPTSIISLYIVFQTRQVLSANPWSQAFCVEEVVGPVCIRQARANLSELLYARAREAVDLKLRDKLSDNLAKLGEITDVTCKPFTVEGRS
ncbi:hypothetical protein QMK50_16910 [Pseudomonas sp. P5_152]|uniref:hypothetical protein n=1 Tax=Pseudomonas sp. P5_152 TaxID=3043442 RepID=UPI002A36C6BB|nr:hypothetical protein [Pseudomonas sp. P5_152]MDX9666649.1 hypothetical protein [Pseudomonas sp. P5_152]